MHQDDVTALFDQQAASYDTQWAKTAAIRDCLHFLVDALFADLPAQARILSVGVGTGVELAHLAKKNPEWRFTVVEPSARMMEICRQRAEDEGFASRCEFHTDYIDNIPRQELHDGATCFLVSQFITDRKSRVKFFAEIADRLKTGGLLASSDLASDVTSAEYDLLLRAWINMMSGADITPDVIERIRKAYANDVAVLPPADIRSIIQSGGFETPTQFFQAGLIHGWASKRA